MKLCIDCRYYGGVVAANLSTLCNHPLNKIVHPVDGREQRVDASWLRMAPEFQDKCGWDAKWWEKAHDRVIVVEREEK